MLTSPPSRISLMLRSWEVFPTARCTRALARRKNLWRFSRLLLPGFRRRSTMCMAAPASVSPGLLHAHIPLDQATDLTLGIAARLHAFDKLPVLLFVFAVLLRPERDHRQQIFRLGEHPLLDHLAYFLVARPGWVLAGIAGARAQRKLDDLVAEILRVGDPGRLFDLGELLVEQLAVEQLAGVRILEVLVLDPGIGVVDIAVEQILPIVRVGFQIGLLNFMPDEFGVARRQLGLDELEVALLDLVRQLLAANRLLEAIY